LRPEAPLAACLASSMTTLLPGSACSSLLDIHEPLIPDPMTTISATLGRSTVLLRSAISSGGSCQYDIVGFGRGKPGGIDPRSSMRTLSGPKNGALRYRAVAITARPRCWRLDGPESERPVAMAFCHPTKLAHLGALAQAINGGVPFNQHLPGRHLPPLRISSTDS